MSEPLYKAVLKDKPSTGPFPILACQTNHAKASLLIKQAMSWLLGQRREGHLVSSYNNADANKCEAVIVLTDRNTALMLKLALIR